MGSTLYILAGYGKLNPDNTANQLNFLTRTNEAIVSEKFQR